MPLGHPTGAAPYPAPAHSLLQRLHPSGPLPADRPPPHGAPLPANRRPLTRHRLTLCFKGSTPAAHSPRAVHLPTAPHSPRTAGPLPGTGSLPASKAPPRRPTPRGPPTSPRRPTPRKPPAPYPAPAHSLLQRLHPSGRLPSPAAGSRPISASCPGARGDGASHTGGQGRGGKKKHGREAVLLPYRTGRAYLAPAGPSSAGGWRLM